MIIDLSVALNQDTPAFPGDPKIAIQQATAFDSEGYLGHSLQLGTHTGTHVDVPAHMIEGSQTLDQLPLDTFIGPGKVVKGFSRDAIDTAAIMPGDIVLFDTGSSARFLDPSYFTDYPVMPDSIAEYLVSKKIELVGLDSCSADNSDGFPVHKTLLSAGIPIIENLMNLSALHGKTFQLICLPLKFDLDGAPARAIAVVQDA